MFEFINKLFRKTKVESTSTDNANSGIMRLGDIDVQKGNTKEFLEEMKGWVFSAVTAIADQVASVDINLKKVEKGQVIDQEENDILDLLYRVNSFTTKFDLLWLTAAYLELVGEAPWYIETSNNKPTEIFLLDPSKLTIVPDKTNLIKEYKYTVGDRYGNDITIPKENIILLRNPDPSKIFRGLGTLEAAAKTVDLDNYAEEWNKNFYKNSARPDSILTVNNAKMSPKQLDVLKNSIKTQYQGIKNSHKLMVLFGDMKLDKSTFTQKDMDFLEQQKFGRDKILGIFRVPKAIVAQTDGVNYASAKAAQYIFAKFTIKPKVNRIIAQLNEFLIPMFKGEENTYLEAKNVVPQDEEFKLTYNKQAINEWLTINEVRDAEGYDPVTGGDVIYKQMNIMELGGQTTQKVIELRKEKVIKKKVPVEILRMIKARDPEKWKNSKNLEKLHGELKKEIKKVLLLQLNKGKKKDICDTKYVNKVESDNKQVQWSQTKKEEFWLKKHLIYEKYLKRITKAQVKVFEEQKKLTLSKIKSTKSKKALDIESIFLSIKTETGREFKLVMPLLEKLFAEAYKETNESIDIDGEVDLTDEDIRRLINAEGRKFSVVTTEETNKQMEKVIVEGLKNEDSIPQIKSSIGDFFDNMKLYRAERVARTEGIKFNTSATEQSFIDSGIVEYKEWKNEGSNPCPQCLEMNGKRAKLKTTFLKQGESVNDVVYNYEDISFPPLHPNCECDIVPIFIKEPTKIYNNLKKNLNKYIEKTEEKVKLLIKNSKQNTNYMEESRILLDSLVEKEAQILEQENELKKEKCIVENEKEVISSEKKKILELKDKLLDEIN